MKLIQMIQSAMPKGRSIKEKKRNKLSTEFGEQIDPEHVLTEYPRPQLVRESYINLNGYWEYAIVRGGSIHYEEKPEYYDGNILVPFSPETALSGVERQLQPGETLWYHRTFLLEEVTKGHLLLHFGAVDERCAVWVNGQEVCRHAGGYLPFEAEITPYIRKGENELVVCVKDDSDTSYHTRGKQRLKSAGIFYTAQSGIWQTVWMEWVPEYYIKELIVKPQLTNGELQVEIQLNRPLAPERADVEIAIDGAVFTYHALSFSVPIHEPRFWSPEHPELYAFTLRVGEDRISSYTAFREFTVEPDERGISRVCLNGKPYFLNGVLDQGYWPESLLTPPSEEAMRFDIETMKRLGFNMLRKHCKIEPLRWYYLCDKIGMIVWQDIVNGGSTYFIPLLCYLPTFLPLSQKLKMFPALTGRSSRAGQKEWERECEQTLRLFVNVPCVGGYTAFNEGWGQFGDEENEALMRSLESGRLLDMASGWFDRGRGDIYSTHDYFRKLIARKDKRGRAYMISEYGGLTYFLRGHTFSEEQYGYRNYTDKKALKNDFRSLREALRRLAEQGLSGAVYTQLSDVEEEVNGILTYDRKVCKLDTSAHMSEK